MDFIIYFYKKINGDGITSIYYEKKQPDEIDFNLIYYSSNNPILNLPIKKLRHHGGQAYSYTQHHFMQYYKYGVEALANYYDKHNPKTIYEKHFISGVKGKQSSLPWSDIRKGSLIGEHGLGPEHGHSAFGPISEKKIKLEVKRLDNCLNSIKANGYLIENSFTTEYNGFPRGYFLISDKNEWVFRVVGAKHRVAALAHLGWNNIPVNLEPNFPRCIFESEISNWPGVLSGNYSIKEAKLIFDSYFRESNLKIWH